MDVKPPPPIPDASASRPPEAVDWGVVLASEERWLRTAVLARVGERQAVDEVMQEVALAALAQRAPLNDSSKRVGWLYRLAIRQALLYRRNRGRAKRLIERYAGRGAVESSTSTDPLDWLLLDERRALVRAAMAKLHRRDAEILALKYTEDWTYRELAARLGVTESAVEARLHRARGRLREALAAATPHEVSP
ncbi:MAG: RNA polymerase sigma factor [Isosphaeraceae bacterium]